MPHHLDGLNDPQKDAALHTEGPLLIIAGAGAGKTRTLTHRILHLIESGVPAHEILAITFTNKAAKEMRDRIVALLSGKHTGHANGRASMPFMSTFHSLGVSILREFAPALGLTKYFSILDKSEALSVIRRATRERGIDPKQYAPEKTLSIISRNKADLISSDEFRKRAESSHINSIVSQIWDTYERLLKEAKCLDFDDLITRTVSLLENNPAILEQLQNRWKYIHIDEYQDTNVAQYQLSKLLASRYRHICVVGDTDQSIFSWRGAHFKNLMRFEKDYPGTKVVLLEENYRSTKTILQAADEVISKNTARFEKTLFTSNKEGEKITVFQAFDESDEARFVARTAKELIAGGEAPSKIAVLYRANYQSRVLEERFLREAVPYQLLGTRFFERAEVKDVLAYIKAAINPEDIESFKRAVATPSRGIGDTTLEKIVFKREDELNRGAAEKVSGFRALLAEIAESALTLKPSELVKFVMRRSGIESALLKDHEDERVENIQELVTLAAKYDADTPEDGINRLIGDAALAADQDILIEHREGVRLMTVHSSKGLEFTYVFVVGLEEGLFPHHRFDDSSDPEEERRLFYVAITRAEEKLYLSWAIARTIFGNRQFQQPSEFLGDISEDLKEKSGSGFDDPLGSQVPNFDEDEIQWGSLGRK